jgi:transposase
MRMRGIERQQEQLFSYLSIEERIPADHPMRAMQALVEPVLRELSPRFAALYAETGRPSIPPERLLRALLLQILYTVRSERALMEQLDFNLLFRWFVGLSPDEAVWDPTVFTKNRDRLLAGQIAEAFLAGVLRQADARRLLSHEHFTVDGTLLEAWAGQKSFRPKGKDVRRANDGADDDPGNPTVNFHGERRSNATHASTTDPDARLAKKGAGKEAKLAYQASVTMDNRHGFVVQTVVDPALGGAIETQQATEMLTALAGAGPRRARTLGADAGYARAEFITTARTLGFVPHVAEPRSARCRPVLDRRTLRHPGYALSQRCRKKVEEGFGWGKTVGLLDKLRHRGTALVDWIFTFTMAAYDLVRLRTLIRAGVCP